MTVTRSEIWSWTEEVLPYVTMLMVECLDMSILTIVKAAMNDGMNSFMYIVYHNALGMLILLPFFIVHNFRNVGRPRLTFHILFRFFILGLLGLCLFQVLVFIGLGYSSPIMASAIGNLAPGNTFLLAVIFRMEKVDIRSSSSLAKLFGTIIAISGAMVFTFFKGPKLLNTIHSHNGLILLSQESESDWVFGGLIILIGGIVAAIWKVLQSATSREYPDQFTVVFFFCLFGTIQCMALCLFLVKNLSDWILQPGIAMVAVVFGAVFNTACRNIALIWCLKKKGPAFVAMFSPLSMIIASTMGVIFLGDSLHLGSALGAAIVAAGFYTVMWGQAKQKKMIMVVDAVLEGADEHGSSSYRTPLLSTGKESKC